MSEVECYDSASCLHALELCAGCVRNNGVENVVVDFYEAEKWATCPECGKPLIAAVGETEANFCWYCNKNLKQMEAEKKR